MEQRQSCVYKEGKSDGWSTEWKTECGKKVSIAAPEEVGMSFAPLPNEDGKFCRHCGGKIILKQK